MEITLKIKDDVYKELKDGKRKLIKKNVLTNINIDSSDILSVSDVVNNHGNILKNFCRVHIREVGPVIVNHSREYINTIKTKTKKVEPIGFKQRK